ncbi:hypothetical protein [Nocardia tengchongensis]
MSDTRLVQTAVLGKADSMLPVYFPPDYEESLQFRREHDGARFFCGHFLGGCGGELVTKISDFYDIVSHFAHHPTVGGSQDDPLDSAQHRQRVRSESNAIQGWVGLLLETSTA